MAKKQSRQGRGYRGKGRGDADRLNQQNRSPARGSKNDRRAREIADTAEEMVSRSNPYSWYAKFPQFTKDAGTIPFATPLGQPIAIPNGDVFFVPGVMRLTFYPTIGYSADLVSPVNRAGLRFFTYMRDIMKAAGNYDWADVMMHFMAMDSAFMFHSLLRRIYGVAQLYTPLNRYYPTALLKLMNVDQSILTNLAEFRAYINQYALSLATFVMPTDFDITARHQWMCEGLYLDSDTTRAQTYMFVPEGFWIYDNTVQTGSQLNFKPWLPQNAETTPAPFTLKDIISFGQTIMRELINDEDIGNINGDLYRLYGPEKTRHLPETPELMSVIPIFDKTVLSQIENCVIMGQFDPSYTPVISQNPSVNNGAIVFTPAFPRKWTLYNGGDEPTKGRLLQTFSPLNALNGAFINLHEDNPSPETVIEATRLVVGSDNDESENGMALAGQPIHPTIFGADIIATASIAKYINGGNALFLYNTNNQWIPSQYQTLGSPVDARPGFYDLEALCASMAFDWGPMWYLFTHYPDEVTQPSAAMGKLNMKAIGADLDNLTYVSASQLNNMHTASLFSLFDVPTGSRA